jgi:hypothetical protein
MELVNQYRGLDMSIKTWLRICTEDEHLRQFSYYQHTACPEAWFQGILDMADSQSASRLAQLLDLASKIQTSLQDKIMGSATWTGQSAEHGREDET